MPALRLKEGAAGVFGAGAAGPRPRPIWIVLELFLFGFRVQFPLMSHNVCSPFLEQTLVPFYFGRGAGKLEPQCRLRLTKKVQRNSSRYLHRVRPAPERTYLRRSRKPVSSRSHPKTERPSKDAEASRSFAMKTSSEGPPAIRSRRRA